MARVESQFDPLALRNNTRHISIISSSRATGAVQAEQWIAQGDSVDLGLLQINSRNLRDMNLTAETALDACRSLGAGSRILSAAYARDTRTIEQQAAVLIMLSRYNTGRALVGLGNGYVDKIVAKQTKSDLATSRIQSFEAAPSPEWDVWADLSAPHHHGASWLIGSTNTHDFLIGAGAQPMSGEPHALSEESGAASGK